MKIDLAKTVFTDKEIAIIVDRLQLASEKGYLKRKSEGNPYLLASYIGVEEKGITRKWNVKMYTYNKKKKGHSLVCVDKYVLSQLIEKEYNSFVPPNLKVLRIDDAGWGFPLCGVMVGISDEKNIQTAVVPVEYFSDDTKRHFQTKLYLKEYSNFAKKILEQFGATPDTHRIEICTGYVNQPLREELRKLGFVVRVVEVKGMLQDKLEEMYREYIFHEVGSDIYYDPKDMKKQEIPRRYREALEYGRKHCPNKIKTGWKALKQR